MNGLSEQTHTLLNVIIAARTGDESAWKRLYRETEAYLNAIVRPVNIPPGYEKLDIVQSVMNNFNKIINSYDPAAKASFKTYVYRICFNHIASLHRRKSIKQDKETDSIDRVPAQDTRPVLLHISHKDPDPYDIIFIKEMRKLVFRAVGHISDKRYRQALLLSFQYPPKIAEWAKLLGLNANTLRDHKSKGAIALKKIISKNTEFNSLGNIVYLISNKSPGSLYIKDNELKLLKGKQKKEAIKLAFELINPIDAAKEMKLSVNKYREILISAITELADKLKTYRAGPVSGIDTPQLEPDSRKLHGWIDTYQENLIKYGSAFLTRESSQAENAIYIDYKNIIDLLYMIYTAPCKPQTIGELLNRVIDTQNISRNTLRKKLNITSHDLASYLGDLKPIPTKHIKSLSQLLNIPQKHLKYANKYTFPK